LREQRNSQGLKPLDFDGGFGTAKAVPYKFVGPGFNPAKTWMFTFGLSR
jgi:hypothetical protein